MKKILVLGYFGYENNQLDGQTIKTRSVYELLNSSSDFQVTYFDTQQLKRNKFLIFKSFLKCLKVDRVIYLPAYKSFTFLFPFYYVLGKICGYKIIYPVIGGWLVDYISNMPLHRYILKHIKAILVESDYMKQELEKRYDISNVYWFPNFRIHNFRPAISDKKDMRFKIVFFARIIKEKGIDIVFRFADYLICNSLQNDYVIDFYGPLIDKDYFTEHAANYSFINYCGQLEGEDIYETLQKYDLLLLPTYYKGEGFPGSILDAYISGIPVVCSRWKYLPEFVEDGKTGYVCDLANESILYEKIVQIQKSSDLLNTLKNNAKAASEKYSSVSAWKIIRPFL